MPLYLNTRNPNVKTLKDFTDKDKIALPAVKVSVQAVTLQMAAEKVFGEGQHGKLDALTVSMSHPDAQTALLSGQSEITAHFGSPPFQYQQFEAAGHPHAIELGRRAGRADHVQRGLDDGQIPRREPEALCRVSSRRWKRRRRRSTRDKKAAAEAYLRPVEGQGLRRRHPRDAQRSCDRLYHRPPRTYMAYANFMVKTGMIKVQARLVEGSLLPGRPRRGGELMEGHAGGANSRHCPTSRRSARRMRDRAARPPHAGADCSALAPDGRAALLQMREIAEVGAFKARGATNAVSAHGRRARRGVVTHSSGNHGAALAYAARQRGIAV